MTDIVLLISSGQGPEECAWVVHRLAEAYCAEAAKVGVACATLEPLDGPVSSALLSVSGGGAEAFASARTGTVRWVGTSPFRPHHKRRNWFVGVSRIGEADDTPELKDADITYQAMRASGPGGQHVNKTESAVRAVHAPTGLVAVSQEQRSQSANRKVARLKLAVMLRELKERQAAAGKAEIWTQHQSLERGNAVRIYETEKFRLRQ